MSNSPFSVDVGKSITVYELKKEMKKEKGHAFDAIDPDTLELWKVSEIFPARVDIN